MRRRTATYDAFRALPRAAAVPAVFTFSTAVALSLAAALGNTALGLVILVVQGLVALAWLAVTDVDGGEGAIVIVALGAVAANVLAVRRDGEDVAGAVSILAMAFVASLALQLFRKNRQRVVEALAGTVSAVVLVVLAAHLLAASTKTGWAVAATAVLCAAAAVLAGRGGDLLTLRPVLVSGAQRGWAGLLFGFAAATLTGTALGGLWAPLSAGSGTVIGAVTGLAAIAADLAVELADADSLDERRAAALRPLTVLLPLVVAAPVAYAAARLLVG
ncbi:MAG TPA: hypothetical protein VNA20_17145 [Frankiaceae bacterium]|nr:hypothetical protein [Frankiaceae bacterium]